ncbi:unnamed protein product [Closterium sp. NIES-65]|nr:unnamed protein product [Closterium sp. NIES-65]
MDGLSLFDLTSGASAAPAADADSTLRSQWATRDAAARLAVRSHLPSTESAHFSQYKSTKTLLPDSLRSLRDHFLSIYPTTLTLDLLEERLLAPEKTIVIVGASRGDPRAPFFEGCSPSLLLPSVVSANAVDFVGTQSVGAASAPSGRRRIARARGARALEGLAGAVEVAVEAAEGVGVAVGVLAGVGASVAAVEAEAAAAVAVGAEEEAVAEVAAAEVELVGVALHSGAPSVVGAPVP